MGGERGLKLSVKHVNDSAEVVDMSALKRWSALIRGDTDRIIADLF